MQSRSNFMVPISPQAHWQLLVQSNLQAAEKSIKLKLYRTVELQLNIVVNKDNSAKRSS
jgi:hypothetical protein